MASQSPSVSGGLGDHGGSTQIFHHGDTKDTETPISLGEDNHARPERGMARSGTRLGIPLENQGGIPRCATCLRGASSMLRFKGILGTGRSQCGSSQIGLDPVVLPGYSPIIGCPLGARNGWVLLTPIRKKNREGIRPQSFGRLTAPSPAEGRKFGSGLTPLRPRRGSERIWMPATRGLLGRR